MQESSGQTMLPWFREAPSFIPTTAHRAMSRRWRGKAKDWQRRDADGFALAPPHDESGHTWHHPDRILFDITKLGIAVAAKLPDYKTRMPAYQGIMDDAEIVAVLSFIKAQWPADIRKRHDALKAGSGCHPAQARPAAIANEWLPYSRSSVQEQQWMQVGHREEEAFANASKRLGPHQRGPAPAEVRVRACPAIHSYTVRAVCRCAPPRRRRRRSQPPHPHRLAGSG
jgi:hypothetical protein